MTDADLDAPKSARVFRTGLGVMLRGSREHPLAISIAIVAGLINGSTMVLGSLAIGWATDNLIVPAFAGGDIAGGVWITAFVAIIGVSALRMITIVIRGIATGVVQFGSQASTRSAVTRQYLRLGSSWHRRHSTGQLLSNATSDVDVQWQPMNYFAFAIGMVFMLVFALVDVTFTSLSLGLITMVFVPLVLALNVVYQRVITPRARAAQAARANVSRLAHEGFAGDHVIRTLGIGAAESLRFADGAQQLRTANTRMGYASAIFDPLIELIPTATVLVVLLVGSNLVLTGSITTGTLVQVIYLLLTMALPLNIIGRFLSVLPLGVIGHERVSHVLDSDEYAEHGIFEAAPDAPVSVALNDAGHSYSHPAAALPSTLHIDAGEIIAVVGSTGAGKSTLLHLIAGLIESHTGEVTYDGTNVRAFSHESTSARVAVVPQTGFVFDDSVRGNVTLGRPIDDAQVWRALRVAQAQEFVAEHPNGLDAPLGDPLSGGQRQRIVLARALAGEPALLILDDATSALDPNVERAVVEQLRQYLATEHPRRTTVVMSASRKNTIALADRVVYLRDGRVVAFGTHAEVSAEHEEYRDIVAAYDNTLTAATEHVS
ncbi:ABC transporter ATP-binding protein [Subtercola endophyticus]|uniref:ABC transporter ATP-binding protein n=1 Tax=Subtercola endophyticus TaxID=2895559 RepID=UPI001E51977D|nr:ABC transporter ATP-binding protein [Subtercola endophyticus]UFS59140.1 ABC transporter ATP-binding protein/permease [Subtercola endophyticus]